MDLKPQSKSRNGVYAVIIIGAVALAGHYTLTSIYNFRQFVSPEVRALGDRYTFPAFHQGMELFAPEVPHYNYELESRTARAGIWTDWKDVTESAGFSVTSRPERVEQSFNHYLAKFVADNFYSKDGVRQFDGIVRSKAYRDALYYAIEMNKKFNLEPAYDSLQIRLNFRFTPQPGSGLPAQYSVLEFPVYYPQTVNE